MMASDAGSAVVGAGRDLRCAAMAGPRPICMSALTSCCLRASQDRSRDHLEPAHDLWLSWPTLELYAMVCGSWACAVAVKSADVAIAQTHSACAEAFL